MCEYRAGPQDVACDEEGIAVTYLPLSYVFRSITQVFFLYVYIFQGMAEGRKSKKREICARPSLVVFFSIQSKRCKGDSNRVDQQDSDRKDG